MRSLVVLGSVRVLVDDAELEELEGLRVASAFEVVDQLRWSRGGDFGLDPADVLKLLKDRFLALDILHQVIETGFQVVCLFFRHCFPQVVVRRMVADRLKPVNRSHNIGREAPKRSFPRLSAVLD